MLSVADARARLKAATGAELEMLVESLRDDDRPGVATALASARGRIVAQRAESERLCGLYRLEGELLASGCIVVAGVDEVGRGALAGPLTAGACVLPAFPHIAGLDDSKRLTPQRRREVAQRIREVAVCWSVAHIEPDVLDRVGVTEALKSAMLAALSGLALTPDHVIVDGHPMRIVEHETAVVGGDHLVAAIAAASVLAKVERDELMVALAQRHPEYGFEINKGYGTPEHFDAISRFGRCTQHRVSFCPGRGMDPLF